MAYNIVYSDTLELVGVTPGAVPAIGCVSVVSFEGDIPNLNKVRWDKDSLSLVPNTAAHTSFDFMSRFTSDERIAILSSTDGKVKDFVYMVDLADFVYTDDTVIIDSIEYLVSVDLLTEERATEILS